MSGLEQRVVVTADDGSLGPLLRVADDRLDPGAAYGEHDHRGVDVVAVVLAGSVRHEWGALTLLRAGDVGVLRSGRGLRHDERAGDGGARVLQCYLRSAHPDAEPTHDVHPAADGWVGLDRADARLWIARPEGAVVVAPPGLVLAARPDEVTATPTGDASRVAGAVTVLVWQLDASRPAWATG